MEDAHLTQYNIAPDTHLFGVFDGHGGKNFLNHPLLKIELNIQIQFSFFNLFQKGSYHNFVFIL